MNLPGFKPSKFVFQPQCEEKREGRAIERETADLGEEKDRRDREV